MDPSSTAYTLTVLGVDLTGLVKNPGGYTIKALAAGFDPGSPEAVKVVIDSFIADGELSYINAFGNRKVAFEVEIDGDDSGALARGAAALATKLRLLRRDVWGEASWTPMDGKGYTGVIDVLNGVMNQVDRGRVGQHVYLVELECMSWVRSATPQVLTFTTGATTTTSVDACASLTGWTFSGATLVAAPTIVTYLGDSAIQIGRSGTGSPDYVTATRAGTIAAPYVGIVTANVYGGGGYPPPTLNGAAVFNVEPLSSGYQIWWFANPGGSSYAFTYLHQANIDKTLTAVFIGAVVAAAVAPTPGLPTATVPGSARAPGTITLLRVATIMDNPIVYADPSMLSNGWMPDNNLTWINAPAGSYKVLFDPGTCVIGDILELTATLNGKTQKQRTRLTVARGGTLLVPMGPFDFTGGRNGTLGATPTFTLTINGSTGTIAASNPPLMIFRDADETALTWYDGTIAANQPLALDAPSIDMPLGGVWKNGLDALDSTGSWEIPMLQPGLMPLFIRSDNGNTNIVTTVTFYPCWSTPFPAS